MESRFELVRYLLIRESYPLQILRRLLFSLQSDNTMHVPRHRGGGNQGLHLSEVRSAHNGLAELWAALYVSQLPLIGHRKNMKNSTHIIQIFFRTCQLKNSFPSVIFNMHNEAFRKPSASEFLLCLPATQLVASHIQQPPLIS